MTRLVLVRHGESVVSVEGLIGGPRTCSGLSPLGRKQAERLHDRWAANPEFTPTRLVCSQYPRAIETAEILAPALGGLPVTPDPGFGEHDPGPECDGLTYDAYRERYDYSGWESGDPFFTTFPGGETIAAFHFRVGTALHRLIADNDGGTVIVACHGGVIDATLRMALKAPAMGSFQFYTRNASITELLLVKTNMWRIIRYNDSAHLSGLPDSTSAGNA